MRRYEKLRVKDSLKMLAVAAGVIAVTACSGDSQTFVPTVAPYTGRAFGSDNAYSQSGCPAHAHANPRSTKRHGDCPAHAHGGPVAHGHPHTHPHPHSYPSADSHRCSHTYAPANAHSHSDTRKQPGEESQLVRPRPHRRRTNGCRCPGPTGQIEPSNRQQNRVLALAG